MARFNLNSLPLLPIPGSNLNHNSPKCYVSSDLNLIYKPQFTNPNNEHVRPSTSYYIPRNSGDKEETNINPISSHSTPPYIIP